jgi:hypothetical protein
VPVAAALLSGTASSKSDDTDNIREIEIFASHFGFHSGHLFRIPKLDGTRKWGRKF